MMRYKTEREMQMDNIEKEISKYIEYDKYHDLSTSKLKKNAPKEIIYKFEQWQKLFKEQEKEDSIFK
ncbi:MAG: hypothetical protein ACLR02_15720 [Clostridium sp.]|jgi:hypothetical protein|nr:hypothetical protein [Clostridium sp.]